jgi:hypothetical protein
MKTQLIFQVKNLGNITNEYLCNVFFRCLSVAGLRSHPDEQSGAERIQDLLPRGGATLGLQVPCN